MRTLLALLLCGALTRVCVAELEPVIVSRDARGFTLAHSERPFIPWGHNYAPAGKLLEDCWHDDWTTIADDFREMRAMGANVARIHLQLGRFMDSPEKVNADALERLEQLLRLAEETGVYLDITGLACYRPADVPAWYDELPRVERWNVQGRFWSAVAAAGADSPAVFCYDLMNEPVVAGAERKVGQWYSGKLLGGFDFVQFISLDRPSCPRYETAIEWIQTLKRAIREKDQSHLITVGQLPSTRKWGHISGFVPEKVAPELDFVSVHVYPKSKKLEEARSVVQQFSVGKPLVIEETFNLTCSAEELRRFLLETRGTASGWIGHFDGETIADYDALEKRGQLTTGQALFRDWLKLFESLGPQMNGEAR